MTESFHQLYELVQKTEADWSNAILAANSNDNLNNSWLAEDNKPSSEIECKVEVKEEPGHESDSSAHSNTLDAGNQYDSSASSSDESDTKPKAKKRKLIRKTKEEGSAEDKRKQAERIEAENQQIRDYFWMNCDMCDQRFLTINEAVLHYKRSHNKPGYLMCCGKKFMRRCRALEHIQHHLNPTELK